VLAHDVLADPSGVPASAASGRPASLGSVVTARPGDSLWTIAERHHGEVSIARYVDELVDLNGGPGIQAGQAVVLP
jgi:LysM repeat protein